MYCMVLPVGPLVLKFFSQLGKVAIFRLGVGVIVLFLVVMSGYCLIV